MRTHRVFQCLAAALTAGLLLAVMTAKAADAPTAKPSGEEPKAPPRQPDVVYVPTPQKVVDKMLEMAEIKKGDVVYDLGCGDGRIVVTAAKLFGARAVGIDINPERIAEAKANAEKAGVEKLVRFEENDLFLADFKEATVVTLFLLPNINLKLRPKLLQDLKPGTRIVSNTFDMGDWKPEKETTVGDPNDEDAYLSHRLFLWVVPQRDAKPANQE
jgi:SAM-dependent methyltransferase